MEIYNNNKAFVYKGNQLVNYCDNKYRSYITKNSGRFCPFRCAGIRHVQDDFVLKQNKGKVNTVNTLEDQDYIAVYGT